MLSCNSFIVWSGQFAGRQVREALSFGVLDLRTIDTIVGFWLPTFSYTVYCCFVEKNDSTF